MSAEKKLSSRELYHVLCKKYPNINVRDDEDLSIENATVEFIKKYWYDEKVYYTPKQIAETLKISERSVYRYAREYNFDNRKKRKV